MDDNKSMLKFVRTGMILIIMFAYSNPVLAGSSISEIIAKLQSDNWRIRAEAVNEILHVDIVIGKGMTRGIKQEYKNNEELRVALINCLKKESKSDSFPGEGYADYVSILVSVTADLNDERALPLFLEKYLFLNTDAKSYVARMKDEKVIDRLLSYLAQHKYPGKRSAALRIIGMKLKLNNVDEEYRHKIKQTVFDSVKDKDSGVRIWALRALIYYDHDEIIPIIEDMAKNDDRYVMRKNSSGVSYKKYTIREEAEKILGKIRGKK